MLFILMIADTTKTFFNNNIGENYIHYNMDFSLSKFNCANCQDCVKTEESITIPTGKECIASIKTTDIPDSNFIYSYFNCPSVGASVEKALCYIDVYNGHFINGNNPNHGSSYNGKLTDYVTNETQVTVRLRNLQGTSTAIFGEPTIRFSKLVIENEALSYTSEKVPNHNANVISTTVKRIQGKVKLNSLHLIDPHPQLSTKVGNLQFGEYLNMMFVPIVANGSHIIGVNVLDDRYIHAWHIERTTVDRVSHVFLEIYAQCRENVESFDLSYILIEKVTTSWRDAIEKWHIEFGDVYDSQEFGVGTWVPFSDVSRCFKSDEEKLEFREVFNAKFQWGPFPTAADHSLPTFAYVEPTLLHTDIPYVEGKTVREMVEDCPTKSEMCEILKKFAVVNSKGEMSGYSEDYGHPTKTITSSIAYDGSARKWLEDNWLIPKLKEGINSGFPHEGIGLDSMSNINPTYQLDNCKDDIPYYLVDPNGNPFVETSGCHFSIMKRERGNATRGYMINSANSLPQYVPFLATSGYETLLSSSPNMQAYTDHYIMRMWGQRFNVGSRALVYLESHLQNTESLLDQIFSVMLVSGASVGPNIVWSECEKLKVWKPFYERYTPIMKKSIENKTFYANGLGNVEASHDQWSSWCVNSTTLDSVECFTLVMKDSTKDAWIKVNGMKKIEFFAPGAQTSVENNNVTIKGDSFKAVVISSEWRNPKKIKNEDNEGSVESSGNVDENEGKGNEPKKGGLKTGVIVAIVVVIVVVVAAVVVGVLLYLRYKKREISSGEENAAS